MVQFCGVPRMQIDNFCFLCVRNKRTDILLSFCVIHSLAGCQCLWMSLHLCINIHPFTIQSDSYSKCIDWPARGFQGHSPSKHCLSNCSDTPPAGKLTHRVLIFHYRATWPWKLIAGCSRNVKKLR